MNHISGLGEYSHKIIAGVKGWFGNYCPLCRLENNNHSLCNVCSDLVLASMCNTCRCQYCMIEINSHSTDLCCSPCKDSKPSFEKIIAAFDYQPYGDLLIYRYKVQKQFWLAPILAQLLYQTVIDNQPFLSKDLILIPVPASKKALNKRGFNPAALITKILAHKLGLKYAPDYLLRVHEGVKQAKLNKEQRSINAAHLYQVNANIKGAKIVIVDDVFTTGSTLNTISKKLLHAGADVVYGWVLARTPNKNKV